MIEKSSSSQNAKAAAVAAVLLAAVFFLVLDLFFIHAAHPVFFWHRIPGAYLMLGFFGALILTAAMKIAGAVLYRGETKEPSE